MTEEQIQEMKKQIKEVLIECLTVPMQVERNRDINTGQPLAIPKVSVEDIYLPAHWIEYLPYTEGAIRGIQETQDKQANKILELTNEIKDLKQGMAVMGEIMLQTEQSLKHITFVSNNIKSISKEENIQIES